MDRSWRAGSVILALLMPLAKGRRQTEVSPKHLMEFWDKIFKRLKSLFIRGGTSGLPVEDDQMLLKYSHFWWVNQSPNIYSMPCTVKIWIQNCSLEQFHLPKELPYIKWQGRNYTQEQTAQPHFSKVPVCSLLWEVVSSNPDTILRNKVIQWQ